MLCVDPFKRLTAAEVLGHPWMKECGQAHEVYNQNNDILQQLQLDECPFSTTSMDRNQDFSFGEGSPVTTDEKLWHSPVLTCKSSFSSFLDKNCTPSPASAAFSFRSCTYESSPTEFSSPVPSMPSFTFFSPSSAAEEENLPSRFRVRMSSMDPTSGESNAERLPELEFSTAKYDDGELERKEFKRGGTNGLSRVSEIHSKRNHTIGLGELDQLNLIVTESVIRWVSCTHIPTVPSLRLSLVC